jgi:AraC-like DNA-binding protein
VLRGSLLAEGDGFQIADVRCGGEVRRFGGVEETVRHGLVFVRRGAFVRRVDGREVLLDSTVGYLVAPGAEQRIAHPVAGGDACTVVHLSPALVAALAGEPGVAVHALPMDAAVEVAMRQIPVLARGGDTDGALAEHVVLTAAALIARKLPKRTESGRPAAVAQDKLVRQAREILLEEPETGVAELGRRVNCSQHHLSRVFRRITGESISGYRNRVRVSRALDRITEGETDLAGLAAELGFADHAHMTRSIRLATGRTPTEFRRLLESGDGKRPYGMPTDTVRSRCPWSGSELLAQAVRRGHPGCDQHQLPDHQAWRKPA